MILWSIWSFVLGKLVTSYVPHRHQPKKSSNSENTWLTATIYWEFIMCQTLCCTDVFSFNLHQKQVWKTLHCSLMSEGGYGNVGSKRLSKYPKLTAMWVSVLGFAEDLGLSGTPSTSLHCTINSHPLIETENKSMVTRWEEGGGAAWKRGRD